MTAERERHALETQRLRDDHAKVVDASTRAAKEAEEARDAAMKSLAEQAASAAPPDRVNAERDAREGGGEELEAALREVREEAAANLDALASHARDARSAGDSMDENLVGREGNHPQGGSGLADSKTAQTRWRASGIQRTRQGGRGRVQVGVRKSPRRTHCG